eukprot:gnl/TRDRNA2_/TRDRNA2_160526_c1_seq1.p1 gnl/TRDRNA2_/TRDRNA2_160526_c1~~gnl/TRDRNA2_/TRDRNA2_160526_c1_seq1.p1  ORF type:complete len:859 (-),score=145.51 gnl/TRDRNA2_/TRDRNA2_160526_c1_seq1:154-2703(-)
MHADLRRLVVQRELYDRVKGTESIEVQIEKFVKRGDPTDANRIWLNVVGANLRSKGMLKKISMVLAARGMLVIQGQMDLAQDPLNTLGKDMPHVALYSLLVKIADKENLPDGIIPFKGDTADLDSEPWQELKHDIKRLKWWNESTMRLGLKRGTIGPNEPLGMERAEILTALCAMLHGPLSKLNPYAYSRPNLLAIVEDSRYVRYASDIAALFMARFNPTNPQPDKEFAENLAALRERIGALREQSAVDLLNKMVDAIELTRKTNFYLPNRYALALRVDPSLMLVDPHAEVPFGVLFVHGAGFDGFHNRFMNIARGGLRIVTPGSAEQHAIESARCYDEVYGLSQAQQLKNKDIPEGGAKAVVLVEPRPDVDRHYAMRKAVKAFTDSMLDLIVNTEETQKYVVDRLGFDELLYLGPDEQVLPEDINWIIRRAGQRGYPIPNAFMSSKPLAGINHKQYGVTSEGVVVFLDVALRHQGIDPHSQPFTVKITGGPDGDVAGNLMRILIRDYGANARIVAVADGSGCAEDPEGLSHDELMRLFELGLPIGDMRTETMSDKGELHLVNTEEGVRRRNTMHSRVKADVFVPGGGRPATVHSGNWRDFLDSETGESSSPLIVEGANIFITPEARSGLYETGKVQIVKDSSANKCGVITSSYEICASMLLSDEEFLAIKEELVQDVLARLRELARMEAELLFREFRNYKGALPYFSERISKSINRTRLGILKSLASMERGDDLYRELMPLFLEEHLPRKLAEVAGDRVDENIPVDYLRNAFASCLASKLLYSEGIHFLESQPDDRLFDLAVRYYRQEKKLRSLLDSVKSTEHFDAEAKAEVIRLLKIGGTRSALQVY